MDEQKGTSSDRTAALTAEYERMVAQLSGDSGRLTVREACRRRMPLDGADAQCLEHALTITERERDEARVAQQDPDADLWRRLQAITGIGELPDTVPMLTRESIVALLEGLMQQLADWQAGAIGAATITYQHRGGPHTEEEYRALIAHYAGGSEAYCEGADMVAAAVLSPQPSGDSGGLRAAQNIALCGYCGHKETSHRIRVEGSMECMEWGCPCDVFTRPPLPGRGR